VVRLPIFAIRAIHVEGEVARNSVSTIRANAAPKLTGNFFTTDLQKDKRAFESVPWVRQAIVRRIWPNRLAVRLEEHKPAAVWGSEATTDKLVNSFGEVFEANIGDVEDDSLPTLSGPEGSSVHMLAMLGRLKPLFERMDAHIDSLSLSGRGSWRAELDTGAEVELGRGTDDEVLARTERFLATLTQVTQRYQRPLEYADLRHNDGYAVRLKGITTVIPKDAKK
jgi:cell division protein FtsQ